MKTLSKKSSTGTIRNGTQWIAEENKAIDHRELTEARYQRVDPTSATPWPIRIEADMAQLFERVAALEGMVFEKPEDMPHGQKARRGR